MLEKISAITPFIIIKNASSLVMVQTSKWMTRDNELAENKLSDLYFESRNGRLHSSRDIVWMPKRDKISF